MFKHIILAFGALVAASAFAAVDINKASQAELEAIKGIGPAMAERMLDERKKAPFKDWNDVTTRVKGVGDASASKFSQNGLTVNGSAFTGPTTAGTAKAATAAGIKNKVDAAHSAAASKKQQ